MKIQFLGAAQEVTGSNYLLECGGKKIFVDCGIYQGRDEEEKDDKNNKKNKNKEEFPVNPSELEAVILTHAHMDHSGRVPFLVKQGFKGKIWATRPTADLVNVLWHDSAHLMMEETAWKNRKNSRKGLPIEEPLYNVNDVEDALNLLFPIDYETENYVCPGIKVCCHNAGHILGSSSLSVTLEEGGKDLQIVFSGDLGQSQAIIGRTPAAIKEANYALIESTYGERRHKNLSDTRSEFRSVILQALKDRGKVYIPSFVIDRAQRILYELLLMQLDGIMPELPIFFDSPMGVKATELYRRYHGTLSDEIQQIANEGKDPFAPMGLTYVSSPDESRKINDVNFGIVIAGSGMCAGGRIVHHLKHGLWNPKNHVIFVGYQSYGTLGRRIIDGATELRIAGEDVAIAAQVHTIGGFSAHGDCDDLLKWAQNFETNPLFFVVHGESTASHAFASNLQQAGMRAMIPIKGQEFQLVPVYKFDESYNYDNIGYNNIRENISGNIRENEAIDILNILNTLSNLTLHLTKKLQKELREELQEEMQEEMKEEFVNKINANKISDIMPLLVSSRTLLEIASDKINN